MRLFVYEFAVARGGIDGGLEPSIIREGAAMLSAVLADAVDIAHCQPVTLISGDCVKPASHVEYQRVDSAFSHDEAFERNCRLCDVAIIIAPEFNDHLLNLTRAAERWRTRVLGCSSSLVELAADKYRLNLHWGKFDVPTPRNWLADDAPSDASFPLVAKPRFGAGSWRVKLLHSRDDLASLASDMLVEEYRPGYAASVSFLCSPATRIALPACSQKFVSGGFEYLGGHAPIDPLLNQRAVRLAEAAVASLPPTTGYLGVDLSLGDDPTGSEDCVIEVNPRLTTSYTGLRWLCKENLLAAWLDLAQGRPASLSFGSDLVEFSPCETET